MTKTLPVNNPSGSAPNQRTRFLPHDRSPSNWLLHKVENLIQPDRHPVLKHFVSRIILITAQPFFELASSYYHLNAFIVKTPVTFFKYTFGQIPPLKRKIGDKLDDFKFVVLMKHLGKAVGYIVLTPFSPLMGFISPRYTDMGVHEKLGLKTKKEENKSAPSSTPIPVIVSELTSDYEVQASPEQAIKEENKPAPTSTPALEIIVSELPISDDEVQVILEPVLKPIVPPAHPEELEQTIIDESKELEKQKVQVEEEASSKQNQSQVSDESEAKEDTSTKLEIPPAPAPFTNPSPVPKYKRINLKTKNIVRGALPTFDPPAKKVFEDEQIVLFRKAADRFIQLAALKSTPPPTSGPTRDEEWDEPITANLDVTPVIEKKSTQGNSVPSRPLTTSAPPILQSFNNASNFGLKDVTNGVESHLSARREAISGKKSKTVSPTQLAPSKLSPESSNSNGGAK